MSYLLLSLLLSFLWGFAGMLILVFFNAGKDNAFRILWGSVAFWTSVGLLAIYSAGWPSALSAIIGGCSLFALQGDTLGLIFFTWGRVLIRLGNTRFLRSWLLGSALRYSGCSLQDLQPSLNGTSLVGYLISRIASLGNALSGKR
jgi:hypothetical protein